MKLRKCCNFGVKYCRHVVPAQKFESPLSSFLSLSSIFLGFWILNLAVLVSGFTSGVSFSIVVFFCFIFLSSDCLRGRWLLYWITRVLREVKIIGLDSVYVSFFFFFFLYSSNIDLFNDGDVKVYIYIYLYISHYVWTQLASKL